MEQIDPAQAHLRVNFVCLFRDDLINRCLVSLDSYHTFHLLHDCGHRYWLIFFFLLMLVESSPDRREHLFLELARLKLHQIFHFVAPQGKVTQSCLSRLFRFLILIPRNVTFLNEFAELFYDLSVRLITDYSVQSLNHRHDTFIEVIIILQSLLELRDLWQSFLVELSQLVIVGILAEIGPYLLPLGHG